MINTSESTDPQSKKGLKAEPFIPIYKSLVDHYTKQILEFTLMPGDMIDSITTMMSKFNVSRETAKRVLKTLSESGLVIQQPGKGTFVASRGPTSKIWAVILPFYTAHYEELLVEIKNLARERDRGVEFFVDYNNWEEEIRLVGYLTNQRYEAIILIPTLDESKTASFYARISSTSSNIILIDHTMAGSFFNYVIQSYDLGVKRGMEYLQKQCNKICFVKNPFAVGRNLLLELMEETYRSEIYKNFQDEPLILEGTAEISSSFCKLNGATGFFCCNDMDAISILGKLLEQGMAPKKDFYLVSYGDTDIARYAKIPITSISPHTKEMAKIAVSILDKRIEGENTDLCQYVVQPELMIRDT